jgi:hypothetical protein
MTETSESPDHSPEQTKAVKEPNYPLMRGLAQGTDAALKMLPIILIGTPFLMLYGKDTNPVLLAVIFAGGVALLIALAVYRGRLAYRIDEIENGRAEAPKARRTWDRPTGYDD